MRRPLALRHRREAIVAVYDALLFLMVAILISAGMFLYSATTVQDGGDFSDAAYQRTCDNQRIMVEGLAANGTLPAPVIEWSNGIEISSEPLANVTGPVEAETVRWMLASFCELTWRNEESSGGGVWDTGPILPLVDDFFEGNRLNGTEHAWLFLYDGEEVLFGSSSVDGVEDLPNDRWASSRDYSHTNATVEYSAELTYFLWVP